MSTTDNNGDELTFEQSINNARQLLLDSTGEDLFVTSEETIADAVSAAIMRGESVGPELSELLYKRLK